MEQEGTGEKQAFWEAGLGCPRNSSSPTPRQGFQAAHSGASTPIPARWCHLLWGGSSTACSFEGFENGVTLISGIIASVLVYRA